ncbi:hypothetical protein J7E45_01310 [Microbacterium sp. ISL-59]|uniref:hypothetical protein n=1 Tax=Microbacterium sp. ISL-59 TaxID=2819159 RepID=UPI001BE9E263|nr:hypothetical protein [Microbacterium sp. ISL-59]MBT2494233.1 hypothetical protein [Microbacterium sp. ISL-59]
MRSSRQGAIPSDLGGLIDLLRDYEDRIQKLEAPSGETLNATVPRLTKVVADLSILVNNIEATLTAFIENDVNDIVDARIAIALASYFAGSVSIGGELLVNGAVQVPGARATDLSTAEDRVTAWIGGDGRLGHTA